MKSIFTFSSILLLLSCTQPKEKAFVTEASCGQCQFELKTQRGCDLAIKIDGKAYFVEGAHIDDYGDAHDENIGFCNAIRKVEVIGKLENEKFKVSTFKIVK